MLGTKVPTAKLFYQFSLEQQVPADHLLRRVTAAVDFSFVRRSTARFYSPTGQPSVDPVVLFKMMLIGFLYGITSERRLAEEIDLHLAYRWFVGYDLDEKTPDHSVLSKARRRFGPTVFLKFFKEIVRQCDQAGLVRGDSIFVDSTLVPANANKESLVTRLGDVETHVQQLWTDNPETGDDAAEPGDERDRRPLQGVSVPDTLNAASTDDAVLAEAGAWETEDVTAAAPEDDEHRAVEMLVQTEAESPTRVLHVAGPADPPNTVTLPLSARQVSRVDPDAQFVQRKGVPGQLYFKVHASVDRGRERIITAVEVTGGGIADEYLLERMIKEHEGNVGRTVREVSADTKYGTIENHKRLEELGKKASIPLRTSSAEGRAVSRTDFVYEPSSDSFVCPEGQRLGHRGYTSNGSGERMILYRAKPRQCAGCTRKEGCCGKAAARCITIPDDGGLRERIRSYLETAHARDMLARRQVWIEGIFGDGKERRGLRRADCRGLDGMRVQAWMTAIAQNIRHLALRAGKHPIRGEGALRSLALVHLIPHPSLA